MNLDIVHINSTCIFSTVIDEEFLEKFFETLLNEINSDEEPYYKKSRQLLLASLNNEHADDFFIAICGWSLESLIERA